MHVHQGAGLRIREVTRAPGPMATVDESWAALDEAKRRTAAKAVAAKLGPGTVVLKNIAGRTVAIISADGSVALVGE